ncbi:AsmA family protein [Bradyrhizobium diazoefficiens]|uniref:Bll6536 protein n=3 Tax=Bradyrhizobium diazoefficiens TaxID=1355477 RepID=Q89G12_BRADU|nr:AsmA-like C-terminal region-containing protein [Bradyrhizobium diazoefficiens]AND91583.1 membrane protein [Bradyrhizobium diazoefficiens USDA 110]QBP25276.1 AsmA family protein [Bradyrhizobium diazoefficiens]QLD41841.1 AsmA family protein [Bradyrhizobium diazoefficiens]WLB36692.1 AsmA-like C-terminal region-containing protein [Bradyrhizobium diazoefficiens]WLC18388.1 AsmA-like C-terminal region-containing protein [Bradyrhizobium diazoefficiens]
MQTTLLGLAIAFIIALLAALIGPYFIDWNQFRPQFEAEAGRIIGVPVRVAGELDARLLPAPTLRLRSVTFGGNNDLGRLRADKLDVEFSLSALMRGEWRATELTVNGMAVDLGLDARGRVDLPSTASGTFNLASLAIERLNLTGRIALHDAASRSTLELSDIAFSGDVRSLAGSVRGDGRFTASGTRYPFRISSGPSADGSATRLHLNIDPGERAILADLEGVLAFDNRLPKFDGALTLAVPAAKKAGEAGPTPWKLTAKLKADPAGAKFDQIDASFGAEDNALKVGGVGDLRFGASPLLRAVLSARQIDADKLAGKDDAEPLRILPALRAGLAAIPQAPIPAQIEFNSDQIMLGGRPLQNIAAELKTDGRSWTFQRLELRAPGMTQLSLNGAAPGADSFSGRLSVESSDPDTLVAWLQGRSEVNRRSTRPLRLAGDVTIAANHLAIDKLKADIEGGAIEGRIAFVQTGASKGSRIDAELKADRLDLDAAASFVRALGGPQGEWPEEARLSLDVGRAISAGQELRPFAARLGYGPASLSLEQLRFGQTSGVTTEASGSFDRTKATGKLALKSSANSLRELTALIEPFAPSVRTRFDAIAPLPGATRLKLDLSLDRNAEHADRSDARAVFDLDAPQLKATATLAAQTPVAAVNGIDIDRLRNSDFTLDSKVSTPQAGALLALLGLDRVVAAGEGASQFEGRLSGAWRRPLQLNAKLSGGGLDADAQGSVELSAPEPKASVNLRVRNVNLAPLFGTGPAGKSTQTVSLSSRLSLSGNRLTFDDLDGSAAGSHLRGRLAVTLDQEKSIDGEVGLDTLDLAPALALAVGAAGRDAGEPLSAGLLGGWRGRIAFQALRGTLPGGVELRPIGGTIRSDGQSLALDALKGGVGGGELSASFDARNGASGVALNARIELSNVDATTLRYRDLALPKGRASVQMALTSQGRSVAALTGALAGNGTVTLDSAEISGLNPRAFEIAIRASDGGQVADDNRLRQLVEPALAAGPIAVASAQIPFTIRDGRLRVGATPLEAKNARAIVSGGYDIPADQADIRASLTPIMTGLSGAPPEIQLFAAGPPDKLNRTVDLAPLSSWLAVRTIDRETRRLDAIERGEPPPATAALPTLVSPDAAPEQVPANVPLPGQDPRRAPPRPKAAPTPKAPLAAPAAPSPPLASQQVAPLPPPIEVRPAPGPAPAKPKPKPPLVLTPSNP